MKHQNISPSPLSWILLMAWRDSRRSRNRLFLFTASVIVGIAALVAINSFNYNLSRDIDSQAKELLGADMAISLNKVADETLLRQLNSIGELATECSFASMIIFPATGTSRLIQVRALEGNFPFYGALETEPSGAASQLATRPSALVDNTLLLQFNARVGDSVQLGFMRFAIEGDLRKVPGQSGIAATVAPPVYIPMRYLNQTGLVQKGSRFNYRYYLKLPEGVSTQSIVERFGPDWDKQGISYETVEERKASVGRAFDNLNNFLNLVGFVALLLGCVGVASSVHVYVKEKIEGIAILRCMGTTGQQAFLIYLVQIVTAGMLGALAGAALGAGLQILLPVVFSQFLPVEVSTTPAWSAIGSGILTGLCMAVLFALLPLINIIDISPLLTLRSSYDSSFGRGSRWRSAGLVLLILIFIYLFAWWQMNKATQAAWFSLGLLASIAILTAIAAGIICSVRKFFPTGWSFLWRQGLANLYRPHNQTLVLVLSIGLGTALIATLFFVQSLLLAQLNFTASGNQPNMVLFDIQNSQKDSIARDAEKAGLPIIQQVPIVTMRLSAINGMQAAQIKADTTARTPGWALDREYRVTYRDSLINSEKSTGGLWRGKVSPGDTIFISLDEQYANRIKVQLGDRLTFNVQGKTIETVVGHFRKVDYSRVQTNFIVLFPEGVLEPAPQFHVLVTRVPSNEVSASFQQHVVEQYPNVSVIDLGLILKTLDEVIAEISFVVRFMALFSITTGLLVLGASVVISRYQRIQESVLLRTLGAQQRHIYIITAIEYFMLGSLASFTGIGLAFAATWSLALFSFEITFVPQLWPSLVLWLLVSGLTVLIGMLNIRSIAARPPLEVLRAA